MLDISHLTPLGADVQALVYPMYGQFPPALGLLVLAAYALVFGFLPGVSSDGSRRAMSTVTVSRADLATEEVVAALRNGLRADYNVLPGMAIGQLAFQGLGQGHPSMVAVGIGDSRLIKAQVTITEPVRTLGGACIDIDDGRGATR